MVLAAAALVGIVGALDACREREVVAQSMPSVVSAGELAGACAGDSLRPAAAAPAQGLWLSERVPGEQVAAMVGPPRPDNRTLVITRSIESIEVSASGDTLRHRAGAATVSLELLPPLGSFASVGVVTDSTVRPHPAATYAVSPRVRLAAYEPCVTSKSGPRIRYLRRDAAGRVVIDVMLHRASEQ